MAPKHSCFTLINGDSSRDLESHSGGTHVSLRNFNQAYEHSYNGVELDGQGQGQST
jgi:hypothetical protein